MEQAQIALQLANEAFGQGDLERAKAHFEEALRSQECGEAYEGLSWIAWSLNEVETVFDVRERAVRLYRQAGDNLGAARMAMWLGSDYLDFKGDAAVAHGWRQRAARLLDGLPTTAEHGWLAIIEGDVALLTEDDAAVAKDFARRGAQIGRELKVSDIEIIGIAMEGICLVTEGDIKSGMQLLDEAAAAALSGEMSHPGYVGWALCYLIYACERVRDYDRAMEWCDKMRTFAEQSQMAVARGICRVHYASVLIWHGDWGAAETELIEAAKDLGPNHHPLLVADRLTRLAELRRRQGRLEDAQTLFRQVEWHPLALLGMAEIALDQGHLQDAAELVNRHLRIVPESSRTQRAAALELLLRIETLLGRQKSAGETLEALRQIMDSAQTPPLRATILHSAGRLAAASGDYHEAMVSFEDALGIFEECGAPYESARARLDLASALLLLGRVDRAKSEAESAKAAFDSLDSIFFAARASALLRELGSTPVTQASAPLLTERQVEVLRLIAQGFNDHEIAQQLVLSEHTVHRHVANILQRLDVSSRAAAAAHATSRSII